jgi:hypothetical protein
MHHLIGLGGRDDETLIHSPVKEDHSQRMLESLDNPIWFALTTEHRLLARSHGLARRYPPDVSPLAALLHPTNDAFADLQRLVSPGEHVALFTASPLDVPSDWRVDRSRWIEQMICEASMAPPPVAPLPLGTTDIPENARTHRCHRARPVLAANNPDGKLFRDTRERWAVGRNGWRAIKIHCVYRNQRGVHSS